MKKIDWLLLSAVALYSYLFYQQWPGANFLFFTIFLILCLVALKPAGFKSNTWLVAAAGSLVSGICVASYGNTLSLIANIVSLSLLSGLSVNPRHSVLFTLIFAAYSYATAVVYLVLDYLERKKIQVSQHTNPLSVRLLIVGLPLLVVVLFFFMYRAANPLFYSLTKNITFNFISWGWISFTSGGVLLLYGFFYHRPIPELALADIGSSNNIYPNPDKKIGFGSYHWHLDHELTTGVILFALLNLLLFLVNILDVNFLYLGGALPAGMSYAESVHQGIGVLIASIIVAVIIILFYFRSHLNFYKKSKNLKLLAYVWVAQNAVLLISTATRNQLYIQEYSLTHKRIGVYVYLLLAFIGLVFTFIKILQAKSNWFLFRKNAWAAYGVLLLAAIFNWNLLITEFNIAQATARKKDLDTGYLLQLGNTNLPELLTLAAPLQPAPALEKSWYRAAQPSILTDIPQSQTHNFRQELHSKLYNFWQKYQNLSWRSWNYDRSRVAQELATRASKGQVTSFWLTAGNYQSLAPILNLTHLQNLYLAQNSLTQLSELKAFPKLTRLDVSSNNLSSIKTLPRLAYLRELNLQQNKFNNLSPLQNTPALKTLDLSALTLTSLGSLPPLINLKALNLSQNQIPDLSPLQNYAKLKTLLLSQALTVPAVQLPVLPQVTFLDISQNNISNYSNGILGQLQGFESLRVLNLANNNLESFIIKIKASSPDSTPAKAVTEVFTELPLPIPGQVEILNLYKNNFQHLSGIGAYSNLRQLDLGGNKLTNISPLAALPNLTVVNLADNGLLDASALAHLPHLQQLNLANNPIILTGASFKENKQLTHLNLSGIPVQNLGLFNNLTALRYLDLSKTQMSNLAPVAKLTQLTYLNLRENQITNYAPLYRLQKLKVLLVNHMPPDQLNQLQLRLPNTRILAGTTPDYN